MNAVSQTPCGASGAIINSNPFTLLIVGHTHELVGRAQRSHAKGSIRALERQEELEQTEEGPIPSGLSGLLRRSPPSPAALLMINSLEIRERYLKVLGMADVETDLRRCKTVQERSANFALSMMGQSSRQPL